MEHGLLIFCLLGVGDVVYDFYRYFTQQGQLRIINDIVSIPIIILLFCFCIPSRRLLIFFRNLALIIIPVTIVGVLIELYFQNKNKEIKLNSSEIVYPLIALSAEIFFYVCGGSYCEQKLDELEGINNEKELEEGHAVEE
ncbi:hypothetical protein BCR32DRAFT_329952 [Anaeromyces robustus]|uniref:Uncharacterized protein n=1 Tax=Anaeromyces robustus TaxID=1754192 RepID=A0A1Y1WNK7_9FUNG|nr:hypothetical protein BCR32DRAFT_329952 [Anaeromyces robustus]|eukprot:ORX75103.1 hypothetical protein BCR32DRAFT_329952 [Anaeromyces robustus]